MSVTRHSAPPQRVTEALFDAASNLGHPPQHDLNGGGAPGYGLVPRNIDRRGRVSTARSYLEPALGRANLRLRLGVEAQRMVIRDGRAVGVEVRAVDGSTEVVRAAEVVLSAGAVRSAALLWRSGIGPADALRAAGVGVVVDAAGLGVRASNHPAIDLFYEPMPGMVGPEAPLLQGALHLDTPSGAIVEVLAMCRPYGVATGADPTDGRLSLRVSPMSVERPTRVVPDPGGVSVDAGYLEDPRDRTAAREAVRAALELVRAAPMRELIDRWHGPDDATVAQDPVLDAWIAEHVGTSHHLCSTAPMGPDADPTAVVDEWGRVRGVDGLRVVDLSILPTAPSRGPACSAVLVAEHLAETFD
jgi:choline dehydrogenase-like flavoprotein